MCCRVGALVTLAAAQPTITPVTTGAVIAHTEPVHQIKAYAKVYVTLTEPRHFENDWHALCDHLAKLINARFPTTVAVALNFRDLLLERVSALRARFQHNSRVKRGILNFIGDMASELFGIPSASDLDALSKINKELASEIEGVASIQQQVIAKVNHLGLQQDHLKFKVNQIIAHQTAQDDAIRLNFNVTHELQLVMQWNQAALRLENMFELITDHLRQYEANLGLAQALRVACESRIVNEKLIPIEFVKRILATGENHINIDPIQYFSYIRVEKITEIESEAFCVLRAPLFSSDTQQLYMIQTFPMCSDEGHCVRIRTPETFVLNQETETIYYPDECHGPVPKACRPGVVYDKNQLPCLHGLITNDITKQKQCIVLVYDKKPPPTKVSTEKLNRYIVQTAATLYHYRCPRRTPLVGQLDMGNYIIDVEPRCILDAAGWLLHGLPDTNITFRKLSLHLA